MALGYSIVKGNYQALSPKLKFLDFLAGILSRNQARYGKDIGVVRESVLEHVKNLKR